MRRIRYDLSNKLTTYGTELIYRKIFDPKTTYDAVFFDDLTTIKKLHLYYSNTQYIESDSEEISISEYKYLQIDYYFNSMPEMEIRKIVLEDSHGEILKLDGQYVATLETDSDNTDEITCVTCRFVIDKNNTTPRTIDEEKVRWTPVIMTDFGLRYIYESLANMRNEKVNFIFTGAGEPNNRFDNCHIDHLLDDVKVSGIRYFNRYCQISGRKPFPYSTTKLNEVGLGFYFHPRLYCKNYLATKDRNWQRKLFPIDRHSNDFPDTLEFDHPVLALRVRNDEYACVWYSGNKGEEDTFPNLSFSAKFYINLIYDMWYSDELIDISDSKPSIPEKTIYYAETMGIEDTGLTPPPEYKSITTAYGNGTESLNYGNVSDSIASGFTGVLYKPIKVTTNGAYVTLYTRYITKNHITGGFWFNQTVTYSSKNFFLPNSRKYQLTCEHPTLGTITDFQEGTDFVCTATITENDGVITYQEELKIPAGSRLRVLAEDFPNTYDTVGVFTTSYRQRNITFTEAVDYTQSPGSISGDWWTTWYRFATVEGGRLYRAYATIYLAYQESQ